MIDVGIADLVTDALTRNMLKKAYTMGNIDQTLALGVGVDLM